MIDLQKYCLIETADLCRPDVQTPYSRGEHSLATNGHIMVRVPRRADIHERDDAPRSQTVEAMIVVPAPQLLPRFEIPAPDTCHICQGYRRVRPHGGICDGEGCELCHYTGLWPDKDGTHEDRETCPKCSGRGTIWPKNSHVLLSPDHAIDPLYYTWLTELPGVEISLHAPGHVTFRFAGGDGILMGMRLTDAEMRQPPGYYVGNVREVA